MIIAYKKKKINELYVNFELNKLFYIKIKYLIYITKEFIFIIISTYKRKNNSI